MHSCEAGVGRRFCDQLGSKDVATVFREIERKYDAAGAGVAALDAVKSMIGVAGVAAVSQQDEEILDAVYYDTKDLRLIRAGVTLRRRTGGEDAGWHLKLPAGADTRDEIRLPLATPAGEPVGKWTADTAAKEAAGPAGKETGGTAAKKAAGAASGTVGKPAVEPHGKATGAVPEELAALVRAHTRGAALAPVVHMRTRRGVLRLLGDASRTLAEIATDHVSAEQMDESSRHLVGRDRG